MRTPPHLEATLAAALLAGDAGEIAAVDLYSRRTEPPTIGRGMTLGFHDASKIDLTAVRTAPARGRNCTSALRPFPAIRWSHAA